MTHVIHEQKLPEPSPEPQTMRFPDCACFIGVGKRGTDLLISYHFCVGAEEDMEDKEVMVLRARQETEVDLDCLYEVGVIYALDGETYHVYVGS